MYRRRKSQTSQSRQFTIGAKYATFSRFRSQYHIPWPHSPPLLQASARALSLFSDSLNLTPVITQVFCDFPALDTRSLIGSIFSLLVHQRNRWWGGGYPFPSRRYQKPLLTSGVRT